MREPPQVRMTLSFPRAALFLPMHAQGRQRRAKLQRLRLRQVCTLRPRCVTKSSQLAARRACLHGFAQTPIHCPEWSPVQAQHIVCVCGCRVGESHGWPTVGAVSHPRMALYLSAFHMSHVMRTRIGKTKPATRAAVVPRQMRPARGSDPQTSP